MKWASPLDALATVSIITHLLEFLTRARLHKAGEAYLEVRLEVLLSYTFCRHNKVLHPHRNVQTQLLLKVRTLRIVHTTPYV